jgi:hypothetical protein
MVMIRAVFKDGVIQPVDPMPSEWRDGRELVLKEAGFEDDEQAPTAEEIDEWYENLEAMVAKLDPNDLERIEQTIRQADVEAKAWMRREMGLGE